MPRECGKRTALVKGETPHALPHAMRDTARMRGQYPNQKLLEVIGELLELRGLKARKASLLAGLGTEGIRNIQRGHRPKAETLRKLAKPLGVNPSVLIDAATVEGEPPLDDWDEEGNSTADGPPPGYVSVPSLDVRGGLGGGGEGEADYLGPPLLMPASLIEGELRGDAADFLVLEVEGTSMSPDLFSGDRVLIDRRKTNPSQPGIFAVFDGFGIVCKLIERIPRSDPPALRFISRDAALQPYEATVDEVRIIGRVVWFARRV